MLKLSMARVGVGRLGNLFNDLSIQAQPNKLRLKGKVDEKYEEKLLAKANVISASANRLWRKWFTSHDI